MRKRLACLPLSCGPSTTRSVSCGLAEQWWPRPHLLALDGESILEFLVALLHDRLGVGSKFGQQPFEKHANPGFTLIGDRCQILPVEHEFLVFGADLLLIRRGFTTGDPGNHLARIDRFLVCVIHEKLSVPQAVPAGLFVYALRQFPVWNW